MEVVNAVTAIAVAVTTEHGLLLIVLSADLAGWVVERVLGQRCNRRDQLDVGWTREDSWTMPVVAFAAAAVGHGECRVVVGAC